MAGNMFCREKTEKLLDSVCKIIIGAQNQLFSVAAKRWRTNYLRNVHRTFGHTTKKALSAPSLVVLLTGNARLMTVS